ncbi:MAG: hypothetical protein GX024_06945 [Clostridiales bacterium]|nr:hypothetical protein [Clostridiales bacterium]
MTKSGARRSYLTGEKSIKQNIENLIVRSDGLKTLEVTDLSENHDSDIKKFMSLKLISILAAGLVNGINPCSMSMLLFFVSLIMATKVNVMKIGVAFCIGKFHCLLAFSNSLF